ncbi:MAG: ABC transporter permease [Treponema sp.]|nr:ABC transporter permease [Treponema sp.]
MRTINFNVFIVPAIGILLLILLIFALSDEPVKTMYFFFMGPFRNTFSFGNLLNAAVPLILGALGIIITMKNGNLNLGGEGQIYLGAFISTAAALFFSDIVTGKLSGTIAAVISLTAGALFSGGLCALSGYLKAKWNTNELITTFLASLAVIPIINYFVTGPYLDPETSLMSTKKITADIQLTFIFKPSYLNTGIFIAIIFIILIWFFLYKTKIGYEFRIAGFNELFARYGGINTKRNTVLSMAISGALYGLAGGILVLGTHHAVIREFSAGLGWSGLTVALIAFFSPAAVLPCAFFVAWINAGARIAMQNTGLTFEVSYIVQAVIFMLSTSIIVKNLFKRKKG